MVQFGGDFFLLAYMLKFFVDSNGDRLQQEEGCPMTVIYMIKQRGEGGLFF